MTLTTLKMEKNDATFPLKMRIQSDNVSTRQDTLPFQEGAE